MLRPCPIEACQFDKSATVATFSFEMAVIAATVLLLGLLIARKEHQLLKRYALIMGGVLMFELFTQPLWNNYHLSQWSYVYIDISFILTFGWTLILFLSLYAAEYGFKAQKQIQQFFTTLVIATFFGLVGEYIVLALGIRSYSPEVLAFMSGSTIPGTPIPLEAVYYMPVFMALVLSFTKYFEIIFGSIPLVPEKKLVNWKSILIAFVGIMLFEVMNSPAVRNVGWPEWSYLFYNVNILRIVLWVIILGVGAHIVHTVFISQKPAIQFLWSIVILTLLTIPIEGYLVATGMRQYSPTLQSGFSGFHIPGTMLPAEIMFAIPLYLTLMIAFVRYWTSVIENDL